MFFFVNISYKMIREANANRIVLNLKRAIRELKETQNFFSVFTIFTILFYISEANHEKVNELSDSLISKGNLIGHYYKGMSLAISGRYLESEVELKKLMYRYPDHQDGQFLLVEVLLSLHKNIEAKNILVELSKNSKRLKVWLLLSNTVVDKEGYQYFSNLYEDARNKGLVPHVESSLDLTKYFCNAALRSGLEHNVLHLWESLSLDENKDNKKISPKVYFSTKKAEHALKELHRVLTNNNIEMFLVSGTLLGCIREGRFLSHDNDVDVGVWADQITIDKLKEVVISSKSFFVKVARTKHVLFIRHVSGVSIDIFLHYRTPNSYWHAGVKVKWNNLPFSLIKRHFMSGEYLVPSDYHKYLTENYGSDWEVAKVDFDSALDTPNAEVINVYEMLSYLYSKFLTVDDVKKKKYLLEIEKYKNLL